MTRTIDFRYIVTRGGSDLLEIHPVEGGSPTIRMDDSAEIKMSLTAAFVPDARVNWLTDRIRPEMILDGAVYPLGVFLPATVRHDDTESTRSIGVEAYDLCWLVRDTKAEQPVAFASGTKYTTAVEQLLTQCGLSLSSVTANGATLTEIRVWEIGTSYLEIVNELLSEINYKPLWFNADGIAILEPKAAPTAANIDHTLDGDDVRSLLLPQIKRETDIYQSPNVFVVSVGNPDKGTNMTAKAENTQPDSPLSIARRGRRIVQFVKLNNIASQQELQAYADNLVRESLYIGETVEVVTGIFPGYGVADVVALSMGEVFSICIEHSWTMTLEVGGEMRHTLERVVYQYEQ